eukprot:4930311-Pyramimonas_sp.AAC.1
MALGTRTHFILQGIVASRARSHRSWCRLRTPARQSDVIGERSCLRERDNTTTHKGFFLLGARTRSYFDGEFGFGNASL